MSTAGEAASLFGTPDTAQDPFSAALGGKIPPDDTNSTAQSSNAVSDLFGSATDEFPVDGAGSSSVAQPDAQQTWYDQAGQQSYGYDSNAASGYTQSYQPPASYAQTNGTYSQYGQYDQYAQTNAYSQPAASSTSAYQPAYAPQQSYAPQTTYSSYTQPASTYAPASTAQQAPVTQNGTYSASAYDPYKPTQTQSSYEPGLHVTNAPAAPTQSSYDPYKPSYTAAPAPAQTYSYGADSHTQAHVNPPVSVPPPPAPLASEPPPPSPAVSVTQYRPKTRNAYDPPLPPIKVKHTPVPPRPVYNTPPPVSPPPRSTLSPPSLPPPPKGSRRTPDPHSLPPPRRDSHSSALHAPSHHAPTGAYAPPAVNGTAHTATYQPNYNPPPSHGAASGTNGYYGHGHGEGGYLPEGLPKVNDTYAPPQSAYVPGLPQQTSPAADIFGAPDHEPPTEQANHVFDPPVPQRVISPVSEPIPEVDEEGTPQPPFTEPARQAPATAVPAVAPSSPPTSVSAPPAVDPYAPNPSSSPERTLSPPRASSAAPPAPPPSQAPASTYDPYAPPPRAEASDRAKSPSASSVRSIASAPKQSYEPPRRDSVTTSPSLSRPMSSQSRRSTLSSQYDPPPPLPDPKRAISPSGSVRSVTKQSSYDLYAPPAGGPSAAHGRTTSNGSSYSTTSLADPYAPVRHPVRTSSEHTYGSFTIPETTYAPSAPPAPTYDRTGAQVVTLAAPVHSTYAPSPSLLGTNDPLGRASARIPVVSFGFGGKLVTCFHGADMSAGFDVALSARQSTDVHIRSLHEVIPESALDTSATSYPGPLYSDPGSPTASLVRTGAQALKTKKAKVVKYLEDRAEEMAAGLRYHRAGTVDRSRAEARRILVLLLKVMVENDGRLSGSAQVDSAVRTALLPEEGTVSTTDSSGAASMIPATSTELLSSSYSVSSALPNTQDQTVSKTVVRSSQLDKIQDLLARGDRRGACHYAADEKLWSHALLIASSIDKECWKEVVTEWIRAELVTDTTTSAQGEVTNGREPLRVAYSLFGGNGAAAVQELVHPKSLLQHVQSQSSLQIPQSAAAVTPLSPNFQMIQPLNISQEVLATWPKTAAMVLSNPLTPESSAALTALGDQLAAHKWIEAAHACYLLSPQTSPLGGLGSSSRLILLGSPPPTASPAFYKDPDPIIFSEIAEFAMSLATPAKGQEPFVGLPHLQPYRLIRAACLAELGHVQLANRYCEAITGCISRSPYINITFVEQLKALTDRLIAAPQLDKSGSWIGGKMSKPSLDSIGNWLEGRFTKFIAGEGDSPRPEESKGLATQQSYSGPFANYSSISSETTSAYPSPHQSVTDLTEIPNGAPPFRTGSALGNRPPSRAHIQINRASSAMDHVRPFQQRRGSSPIARVASANAATFADAGPYGQAHGPYGNGYTPAPAHGSDLLRPDGDVSGQHSKLTSSSSWGWGASESDVSTPTASNFVHLNDQPSSATSNSGFISLMDDPMLSATPTGSKQLAPPPPRASESFDDDDDDLGLGNSSSKKKAAAAQNGDAAKETQAQEQKPKPAEPEKPAEVKQTASSGWLSRLWKRSDSTSPAPVKANLGEESTFYYDKELKRWVNKTAGAEAAKSSPPPPPPRAQTASPGRAFGTMPPPSPLGGPPRPATAQATHAIDLTSEPPRRPPTRVRSNLVPSDAEGSPATPSSPLPPSATPPPGNGPPMGRPRGAAGKRNVRSRYVDVFSQENGGAS